MVKERCDRLWEVDAHREGRFGVAEAESFERHRAACAACDARHRADERLRALGRALPVQAFDELDGKRRRARLLRDAAVGGGTRGRLPAVVAAVACAAAVLIAVFAMATRPRAPASLALAPIGVAFSNASPAPFAASVHASSSAVWTQRRDALTETIALDAGTIVVAVRAQRPDERLLVALPDGEIEVRGTVFEVTVNAGKTLAVDVREGLVALRLRGAGEALLSAGESWPPPRVVTPSPVSPRTTSPAAPSSPTAVAATASSSAPVPAPSEYDEAMRLYRAGRYDDASRAFHMFAASHPGASEAEDAAFLEASALAFAGRTDAAALVAERFLERYPRSFHAKDAAVLVARVLRDRGDCDRARGVLAPWSTSAAADVRAVLGKCAP